MIRLLRRLFGDRRGSVIAIAAAALPLVLGAAGLAVDTIQWTLWKRQLQRAADSAAFAGVYDRAAAAGSTTNTSTAVCQDLAVNLHTSMPLLANSPCTGSVGSYTTLSYPANTAFVTNQVRVTLRVQQPLPFSSMFMSAAPVITATATAGSVTAGGAPCMLGLSSSGTAIDNGGNTTITAPDCILYSNSSSSNSAAAGGSSSVTAKAIAGVGGIASSNNWHVDQYLPYSPTLPDPLAPPSSSAVTPDPNDMKCAQAAVTTTQTQTVVDTPAWTEPAWTETVPKKNGKGTTTIFHPAVYHPAVTHDVTTTSTSYSGAPLALTDGADITTMKDANGNQANCFTALSVGSNRTLTIPDSYTGPIYINGGDANLKGAFSCNACTIVLTNKDPSNTAKIGTFDSNAQATNNITAPTSGTYNGIAIYQDRRSTGGTNRINGGSGNVLNGVVYFPKGTLWLNGTGDAVSLCSMFIANNLVFNGTGTLAMHAPTDAACSGMHWPGGGITIVRLVA
jgi:Flp pilus assembly protein TadG